MVKCLEVDVYLHHWGHIKIKYSGGIELRWIEGNLILAGLFLLNRGILGSDESQTNGPVISSRCFNQFLRHLQPLIILLRQSLHAYGTIRQS